MRRVLLACAFLLIPLLSFADVTFSQSDVTSAAQAQGFTYRLYITPAGASSPTVVVLTGVTCTGTGTAPIVASCRTAMTPAIAAALITGTSTQMSAAFTATAGEGGLSVPFVKGVAVPTGLSITP